MDPFTWLAICLVIGMVMVLTAHFSDRKQED